MELDRSCRDWFEGSGIELREDCQEKVLEMGMYYVLWSRAFILIFYQYRHILGQKLVESILFRRILNQTNGFVDIS